MIWVNKAGMSVITCDANACLNRIVVGPGMLYPEPWRKLGKKDFCSSKCESRAIADGSRDRDKNTYEKLDFVYPFIEDKKRSYRRAP